MTNPLEVERQSLIRKLRAVDAILGTNSFGDPQIAAADPKRTGKLLSTERHAILSKSADSITTGRTSGSQQNESNTPKGAHE